jgi:3'-phosphoadenosine 5'-phosphosulfate sulfotransferase (PAPS reductase)/FAD synthetase
MKPQYVVVSFSGGKDSTAMLLHMMEIGEHIDEVINVDTGMEFPAMYEHIANVRKVVEDHGIKYTRLANEKSYEYIMLHQEIKSGKFGTHYGFGWPTPVIRWCTRHMKLDLLKAYFKPLKEHYDVIQCIGLAADELTRLSRPANTQPGHRHPLVEWGWSEADCLQYCIERGGPVRAGAISTAHLTAYRAGVALSHPSAICVSYGSSIPTYGPDFRSGRII